MKSKLKTSWFLPAVVVSILAFSCTHGGTDHSERSHSFSDMSRYEKMLENPERAEWQKPDDVIRMMALKKGDQVADVGAGTGYFTRRIAKAVAPGGSVTGYDTERGMVEYMRRDAAKRGYANYRAELVSVKNPLYPAGKYDVVFLCNTYHHVDDRLALVRALGKALKKSGRIVLLDQKMEAVYGPPKNLRIAKPQAVAEFNRAGFVLVKDEDFIPGQYYLEFRAK